MILHVLIAMGAGGRPRHQPQVIPSLRQDTRLLTGTRQGHRRRLTDTDRRRLAALASPRGRKRLQELATLATPDRLLRWPRCLRAQKFNGRTRRPQRGRPPVAEEIERLAVQMAAEHPTWGDRRLQGAWATLGDPMDHLPGRHRLRRRHLDPAPQRRQAGRRWAQVLTRPWEVLAATDGFTGEVATWHGLVTYDVWVIMDLATWQVHMAGMTPQPTAAFMPPCARQLTAPIDGFLRRTRSLIHDRDPKFTAAFEGILRSRGVEPLVVPPRAPHLNAHGERCARAITAEALRQRVLRGARSLQDVWHQYLAQDHTTRHHQGRDHHLIRRAGAVGCPTGPVARRERLGGLLSSDPRETA
jgi:putative transposase